MLTPAILNNALTVVDTLPAPLVQAPLTEAENAIVQASKSAPGNPFIKDLTGNQCLELAKKIISHAAIRLGYNARDSDEYGETVRLLTLDLQKFRGLTRAEIMAALDRGLDGDYNAPGKAVFFSLANFVQWVKAYISDTKAPIMKRHAQIQVRIEKDTLALPPSREEQRKQAIALVNQHVEQFAGNPGAQIWGAAGLYQQLKDLGIYEMPIDQANRLYERALENFQKRNPDKALRAEDVEEIKNDCRQAAYNAFIADLAEKKCHLNESGAITPNE